MDTLTQYFSSDLSLWGLFLSSLLGATLLPGGSELVLLGVLKLHPELFWPAILLGTLGNTLGGMITFGMGYMLPQRQGGSKAAGHPTAYSNTCRNCAAMARRHCCWRGRPSSAMRCA
jgi:membrane protein YqaA with SNARE-associated domain